MTQLTPAQQAVLDTIAEGEAKSYDVTYGGHRFHGYSDHPRIPIRLDSKRHTTAAGRYQMLESTWDNERFRLGLYDFSPESQDKAAWSLAARTYKQKTGRDLEQDSASAKVDWSALSAQWPSLQRFTAKPVSSVQLTPHQMGAMPQLKNPPELDALLAKSQHSAGSVLQEALTGHNLQPVFHDPFAPAPFLTPVNHDPFAENQENAQ